MLPMDTESMRKKKLIINNVKKLINNNLILNLYLILSKVFGNN